MSGSIEGDEAFDKVLAALVEAHERIGKMAEEARTYNDHIRLAESEHRQADTLRRQAEEEVQKFQQARPRLFELWAAADEVLRADADNLEKRRTRLGLALTATHDDCDQIPY